jgi:hypothetical protein
MLVAVEAAIYDAHGAVTTAGEVVIMRHHNESASPIASEIEEQGHDDLAIFRVQIAGGLISEENGGIVDQLPGDGDALLLPAAEFRREVIHSVAKTDPLEELGRASLCGGTPDHGRNECVFESREFGKQEVGLENKSHVLVAKAGEGVSRKTVKGLALKLDRSGFGSFQSG